MLLYALTIFSSAFLLFLVQPVLAKQILPWFGGSAAVWTTCLVFFQSILLAGYAYSDFVVHRMSPRAQVWLHWILLAVALAFLPIIPGEMWKPAGSENPSWLILGMLVATVGLPYFLLSTTSPLIQAWFARTIPNASPYRLFALSNLASLLALVAYPFAVEPFVSTRLQALGWSAGFVVFAALCGLAAWTSLARATGTAARLQAEAAKLDFNEPPPTFGRQVLWCALAGTGSFLLLAVSNHICQNISAIPLLWILPLSLYLATFILCFDGKGWYRRHLFLALTAATLGVMAWTYADPDLTHDLRIQISVFSVGLFVTCMFCHGELVEIKPAPRHLTRFYLMISLGGALGSVLVGIVAPLALPAYFELGVGIGLCALLLMWRSRRDHPVFVILGLAATIGAGYSLWYDIEHFYDDTILARRNFYGVLRVKELGSDGNQRRSLVHGTILHGNQYLSADLRVRPTTYYVSTSGIGRLLDSFAAESRPLRVGVIGLGAGTLATYGRAGDVYRFYDINPAVVEIARRDFSYLTDSKAKIEVALGDARLNLEREPPQQLDVLAIDAFSSDSIPVHLITREALQIYRRHLKPGGVIAFHVTNRFLDLIPVVDRIAEEEKMQVAHLPDEAEDDEDRGSRSDWVLVTQNDEILGAEKILAAVTEVVKQPGWRTWTDDFNNMVQVLK